MQFNWNVCSLLFEISIRFVEHLLSIRPTVLSDDIEGKMDKNIFPEDTTVNQENELMKDYLYTKWQILFKIW